MSGWFDMKQYADTGIFVYYICFIDLDRPWAHDNWNMQPTNGNEYMWWYKKMPGQTGYVSPDDIDNKKATIGSWIDIWGQRYPDVAKILNSYKNYGPFVLKQPPISAYPQIAGFYKSFWSWGGSTLTLKPVCDPLADPRN